MHLVNIGANISVELFIYQAALKNFNFSNLLCTFNLIIYCPLVFHFILFQMLTVEHVDLNSINKLAGFDILFLLYSWSPSWRQC